MEIMLRIIRGSSDPREQLAAVHNTVLFSVNTDDERLKNRMIDWYLDYFSDAGTKVDDLPPNLEESVYSNPRNAVVRNGRRIAPDYLRTLLLQREISRHCALPQRQFRILELGAGYGGLARSLKLRFPNTTYVIIDIPESMYFSYMFLRLNFPEARVLAVTDASAVSTDLDGFDFVFVPTMFASELKGQSFELFCNTASLGEMTNDVISSWIRFVQDGVSVRYFFGLNRYLNTIDPYYAAHHQRLNENACSVSFDSLWDVVHWELQPAFTRCPYYETQVTRNLEVILERPASRKADQSAMERRSKELLEMVHSQDWYTRYGTNGAMSMRDNDLSPDLTRRGTLFALWESIRLAPGEGNVRTMLQYLTTLSRLRPFEEMYHYQDRLDALTRGNAPKFVPSIPPPFMKARNVLYNVRGRMRDRLRWKL